jgi:hypothetical protein
MDERKATTVHSPETVPAATDFHLRQDLSIIPDDWAKQQTIQRNNDALPNYVDPWSDTWWRFAKATSDAVFEMLGRLMIKPHNTCDLQSICGLTELPLHALDLLPICRIQPPSLNLEQHHVHAQGKRHMQTSHEHNLDLLPV